MSATQQKKSKTLFDRRTKIIAEVGCNHGGLMHIAKHHIHCAAAAGADTVKFQCFFAENLVNPGDILEFCKISQLSFCQLEELQDHCLRCEVEFLLSAFCIDSLKWCDALGLQTIKVPSGQIFNMDYLAFLGRMKKNVILSTGMCTMRDIDRAMLNLAENGTPAEQVTLMQCTTAYPAPVESANVRVMQHYKARYTGVGGVGLSDHTPGWDATLAAVALGANVIEKHFRIYGIPKTPDYDASLPPKEFRMMVEAIEKIEAALGHADKEPQPCEAAMEHRKDIGESHERRTSDSVD